MTFSDETRTPDHESDPAHTPGDGWVGEGGASHLGPATHIGSAHVEHHDAEVKAALEEIEAEAEGD